MNTFSSDNQKNAFITAMVLWINEFCYPEGLIVPSFLYEVAEVYYPKDNRLDRHDRVISCLNYLTRIGYIREAEGVGRWRRLPAYHETI